MHVCSSCFLWAVRTCSKASFAAARTATSGNARFQVVYCFPTQVCVWGVAEAPSISGLVRPHKEGWIVFYIVDDNFCTFTVRIQDPCSIGKQQYTCLYIEVLSPKHYTHDGFWDLIPLYWGNLPSGPPLTSQNLFRGPMILAASRPSVC